MMLRKSVVAISLMLALSACSDDDNNPTTDFKLTVAHMNDTHSYLDGDNLDLTAVNHKGEELMVRATELGGYPRLATRLSEVRAAAEANGANFLALHGGDAFQGTLYFTLEKGQANANLLDHLGLDGMVIGNHEFDLGNGPLASFINSVNFPVLAANLDTSADSTMKGLDNLKAYTIKEYNGEKVGIFGLVLEDMETISSPGEDLKFNKEIETAQAIVDKLKAEGVNKIVMVSHIGIDRDIKVAQGVNGVDLIVGGHSHTRLGDFDNLGLGKSDVAYAQTFTNKDGKGKTCVVQAGDYASMLGQVNLTLNEAGELQTCEGGNVLMVGDKFQTKYDGKNRVDLTDEDKKAVEDFIAKQSNIAIVKENLAMREIIDFSYKPPVAELKAKVIGNVSDTNDPKDKKSLDHTRIPGVAKFDASLPGSGSEAGPHVAASMVMKMSADMAITNTGGVRNNIVEDSQDGLTAGYILGELLPFGNTVVSVDLTGAEVKELLETTTNYALTKSDGAFPTTANLSYTYNGKAEVGDRVELLEVCNSDLQGCNPIDLGKTYTVATTSYLAEGKDGYELLKGKPMVDSGFVDNEVMMEYIEAKGTLVQIPSGLTFHAPTGYKLDNPVKKDGD